MNVGGIWLIYIILVVILWLIFWVPQSEASYIQGKSITGPGLAGLFYALLIGFLFVYLLTPAIDIDQISDEEHAWLNGLIGLSILLPLVIVGIMITSIYQHLIS